MRNADTTTSHTGGTVLSPDTEGDTTPGDFAAPSNWIRFEGRSISLMLPDYFSGGKPTDASVRAALDAALALYPGIAGGLELEALMKAGDIELAMVGEVGPNKDLGAVSVSVGDVPAYWSVEAYARAVLARLPGARSVVERVTHDRAYCRVSFSAGEARFSALAVFVRAGTQMYTVTYLTIESGAAAMESIFRSSAETIVTIRQAVPIALCHASSVPRQVLWTLPPKIGMVLPARSSAAA